MENTQLWNELWNEIEEKLATQNAKTALYTRIDAFGMEKHIPLPAEVWKRGYRMPLGVIKDGDIIYIQETEDRY